MSDTFIDTFGRQLQSLGQRLNQGTQQTRQAIAPEAGTDATEFPISPEQVMGIMQGNSAWMQQFEQNLEQSFSQLGDRILDKWLKNTDSELRKSIRDITELLSDLSGDAATRKEGNFLNGIDRVSGSLGRIVTHAAGNLVEELFTHTRHSVSESDRSREEGARFRNSRGQAQADLSRELSQGKRYL